MAYPAKKLTKIHNFLLLPSITRVSWQRIKRAWPLLGVIWLAMLMLITLVCVEPLFARVTTFALFQNLARSSQGGPFFPAVASSRKPTSEQIQQAEASFTQQIQTGLGDYIGNGSTVVLKTPDLQVLPSAGGATVYHSGGRSHAASGGPQGDITQGAVLSISGYDIPQIASRIRVVKGRLPDPAASQLEAAISEKTALDLKLQVGSDIKIRYPASAGLVVWQLHVVGLIHIESSSDDFWHTLIDTGEGNLNAYNGDGKVLYNTSLEYNALVPRSTLLTETSKIDSTDQFVGFTLAWNYPVNLDRLNANTLGEFLERYHTLQILQSTHIDNLNSTWLGPSDFVSGLYRLQNMLIFGQIIAYILLCLTMGMALLMTGIMSYVLIERQMPTIAAMRSRGASRSYVVGTFAAQGTLLVLLAMLIGPLLAFLLTRFLTMSLLSAENQSALDFFTQNFSRVWLEVRGLVFVAGILAFVTMLVAIYRATKIDITLLRRETARATRAPFWRRFYLDIILAVFVSLGYALYIYTFLSPLANNARVQILQTLFSFIAVPLILIAIVLLFLRIMPWLFHLATRIVSRTSSTVALLAFAQIERSPRASARLILLLALALASSAYLLNLADTQLQWYPDQANFRVGADFKGPIDTAYIDKSFAQLTQRYSTLAGVRSVTLGYEQARFESPTSTPIPPISLDAVDADTYANTGLWSPDYSHQPLTDLMQQLKAHRTDASTQNIVYVIVDTNAWNVLSLSSGTEFTLPMPGYTDGKGMHFKVLERINNIPGMYDNLNNSYSGLGLLV
ncbi:MAG TPA: ABC transporter permease, partial [Ktedonobacteraceae bacterium]|nr:ABC transporter permease [Ktedonobacteraceae bacterium]